MINSDQTFQGDARFSAFDMYTAHQDARLMFAYRGPFFDHLTEAIIGVSEHTLENQAGLAKVNRKVSFLLVECFQNILKHGEKSPDAHMYREDGVFSFRSFHDSFYINSINPVLPEDRDRLKEMVEQVNAMDRQELKDLYKRQLEQNALSDRGGAGLGLIELARKSGQPIRYDFEECQDGGILFHNQVHFKRGDEEGEQLYTDDTRSLRSEMIDGNVLLSYKGDFSQGAILPLLNIVEQNLADGIGTTEARKVGHVLIEMLQNISRHAPIEDGIREGVMLISSMPEGLLIETGNRMPTSEVAHLQERLSSLKGLSEEEVRDLHLERFKDSVHLSDRSSSGLGLLQVAKASKNRLAYSFDVLDSGETFFSLGTIV
jgi:hypothetical protein